MFHSVSSWASLKVKTTEVMLYSYLSTKQIKFSQQNMANRQQQLNSLQWSAVHQTTHTKHEINRDSPDATIAKRRDTNKTNKLELLARAILIVISHRWLLNIRTHLQESSKWRALCFHRQNTSVTSGPSLSVPAMLQFWFLHTDPESVIW